MQTQFAGIEMSSNSLDWANNDKHQKITQKKQEYNQELAVKSRLKKLLFWY